MKLFVLLGTALLSAHPQVVLATPANESDETFVESATGNAYKESYLNADGIRVHHSSITAKDSNGKSVARLIINFNTVTNLDEFELTIVPLISRRETSCKYWIQYTFAKEGGDGTAIRKNVQGWFNRVTARKRKTYNRNHVRLDKKYGFVGAALEKAVCEVHRIQPPKPKPQEPARIEPEPHLEKPHGTEVD